MPRPPLAAIPLLLALAACAGAAPQADDGAATRAAPRRSRTVITADELARASAPNALEAIQRLRPEFIRARGSSSISTAAPDLPQVFVDGLRAGGLEVLSSIRPIEIEVVRFISASDATTRYGTGFPGGVIEIETKGMKRR